MADTPPLPDDLKDAALLIAAHGSPGSKGGRTSTRRHAERIANQRLFGEVAAGFLTEKPFADDVLDGIDAPVVYIVPNMTAAGYITTHKLPKGLGLTGRVTEHIGPRGRQRLVLCDPVGTHPLVPKIFAGHILRALTLTGHAADPDTAVVVVGHGSTKGRESFARTAQVAADMAEYGLRPAPETVFLEEAPFVKDWRDVTDAKTVLFAPFLISDGFHGSQDIPLAIGFDPGDKHFQETLAQGGINETQQDGRRILYIPPVGDIAEMAELVVARALQARELTDI